MEETLISKKAFLVLFAILLVIGLGVALVSNFNQTSKPVQSPSPSPQDLLFNDQNQSQTRQNQQQAQNLRPPQEPQKQPKQYPKFPGVLPETELNDKKAVIKTKKGLIEFVIDPSAPKAASNFIFLTKEGFYDGLTFHRVVPGFVIQGGDPTGTGSGGPGYRFEDEKVLKKYLKGVVAMANAGPNTNGSQFFIVLEDQTDLPPNYTIFGAVIEGMDVVEQIKKGDVMEKVTIEEI